MGKNRKKKSRKKGQSKGSGSKNAAAPVKEKAAEPAEDSEGKASQSTESKEPDSSAADGEEFPEDFGNITVTEGSAPDAPSWDWERKEDEPNAAYQLRRLNNAVGVFEAGVISVLLFILIGVASYQALAGRIFNSPLEHGGEIIIYAVFWIAVTGAALAAQRNRLISMDLIARMLSGKARAGLRIVLACFSIFILILVLNAGLDVLSFTKNLDDSFIGKKVGLTPFPIGVGLIAFHIAVHALIDAIYLGSGKAPPEAEVAAH